MRLEVAQAFNTFTTSITSSQKKTLARSGAFPAAACYRIGACAVDRDAGAAGHRSAPEDVVIDGPSIEWVEKEPRIGGYPEIAARMRWPFLAHELVDWTGELLEALAAARNRLEEEFRN